MNPTDLNSELAALDAELSDTDAHIAKLVARRDELRQQQQQNREDAVKGLARYVLGHVPNLHLSHVIEGSEVPEEVYEHLSIFDDAMALLVSSAHLQGERVYESDDVTDKAAGVVSVRVLVPRHVVGKFLHDVEQQGPRRPSE